MVGTSAIPSASVSDMYMALLASLSVDSRLELISKLSSSVKKDTQKAPDTDDLRTMFSGKWDGFTAHRDPSYAGREVLNW